MYLILMESALSQVYTVFSGITAVCGCCCIAAIIFFIALTIYSIARGGFVFRMGNVRAKPPRNYGPRYESRPEQPDEILKIRSSEKVLCEHCSSWVDAGESICPHCGAPMKK